MEPLSGTTIKIEVIIHAEITTVWETLIRDTNEWWRKDFFTSARTKKFVIEPIVGGRMYEDYGNGEGLVWADVIGVDSPTSIQFKGFLSPDFGGPAISYTKITLEAQQESTLLTLYDALFGNISVETTRQIESGWQMIYKDAFKNYVEFKIEKK